MNTSTYFGLYKAHFWLCFFMISHHVLTLYIFFKTCILMMKLYRSLQSIQ
jgi:hypothetical protein